jgi:N-acetylglucosaminyldiphosphoundecaprenol N-acetyl-beta-D-mannosaminyltransferase
VINQGAHSVLGIDIHAVDYEAATTLILQAAIAKRPFAVSALAVHGVMTGVQSKEHARRLNGLDLVVPDGQPVRFALKLLHGKSLPDRVYGPELTLQVARKLAEYNLSVYLYGSTARVLQQFAENLQRQFPNLQIAGMEASQFRTLSAEERQAVIKRIQDSGASAVFVGLGCPRQEVWAFENRCIGVPIIAVGAAFDFHAGTLPQAPKALQDSGLEWLFRLIQEPSRLWRRYLKLNPLFVYNLCLQALRLKEFPVRRPTGTERLERYG